MYATFTENSFLFYNALNQKFQKIHPTVHSLKYKSTVKILELRDQKVPFLHPMPQLHTRSANSSDTLFFKSKFVWIWSHKICLSLGKGALIHKKSKSNC